MIDNGKKNILGILVDTVDYEGALARILRSAKLRIPLCVSALAVHGVITGVQDEQHRFRLNSFDLIVPDGQPVRWALNLLHKAGLKDRVYGPSLTLQTIAMAEREGLPVYFYGSTPSVLEGLNRSLRKNYPALIVAGMEPSAFRKLTPDEKVELGRRVFNSGARICLVGLGCPRQEVFAYEMKDLISMPLMAVGAAFPFIAGELPQAPPWMQRNGLEWLFRLREEPRRLWRRYLLLNPLYVFLIARQYFGTKYSANGIKPQSEILYG